MKNSISTTLYCIKFQLLKTVKVNKNFKLLYLHITLYGTAAASTNNKIL